MTNTKTFAIAVLCFILPVASFAQKKKKKKAEKIAASVTADFLTDFTVNPNPNNLDTVGVIFSIDKNGVSTPIANMNLKTSSTPVIVPKQIDSSNLTFGALINFLKINGLNKEAELDFKDSVSLQASFKVENGVQTRFDLSTDLAASFASKKSTLESNIKFLGIEKNKLFLIIETIRSPEVQLLSIKSKNVNFNAGGVINNLLKVGPKANLSKNKEGGLSYKSNESPVIFYKLRKINVEVVESKGTQTIIGASLGEVVSDKIISK